MNTFEEFREQYINASADRLSSSNDLQFETCLWFAVSDGTIKKEDIPSEWQSALELKKVAVEGLGLALEQDFPIIGPNVIFECSPDEPLPNKYFEQARTSLLCARDIKPSEPLETMMFHLRVAHLCVENAKMDQLMTASRDVEILSKLITE